MTTFQVYMLLKVDVFKEFLTVIAVLSIIIHMTIVGIIAMWKNERYDVPKYIENISVKKMIKTFVISFIFYFSIIAFVGLVPSTKQIIAMYVIPKITNEENLEVLNQHSKQVLDIILEKIEKE
jgi:hypothetical protein